MEKYNFYAALAHLKTFHGIHLIDDDFENIAIHGWDKIGNKRYALYLYSGATIECKLKIPCNLGIIEAVTSNEIESGMSFNKDRYDHQNNEFERRIEGEMKNGNPFYISGRLLSYYQQDDCLIFAGDHSNVNVLYKGLRADEKGLPELTYKEVEAIALYCAYVDTNKKGMVAKDKTSIEIGQMLKAEWERACAHARTPEYLNQNEFNDILEVKNSWDRKRYNVSFKPVAK